MYQFNLNAQKKTWRKDKWCEWKQLIWLLKKLSSFFKSIKWLNSENKVVHFRSHLFQKDDFIPFHVRNWSSVVDEWFHRNHLKWEVRLCKVLIRYIEPNFVKINIETCFSGHVYWLLILNSRVERCKFKVDRRCC